jgi:hypothetical protein
VFLAARAEDVRVVLVEPGQRADAVGAQELVLVDRPCTTQSLMPSLTLRLSFLVPVPGNRRSWLVSFSVKSSGTSPSHEMTNGPSRGCAAATAVAPAGASTCLMCGFSGALFESYTGTLDRGSRPSWCSGTCGVRAPRELDTLPPHRPNGPAKRCTARSATAIPRHAVTIEVTEKIRPVP